MPIVEAAIPLVAGILPEALGSAAPLVAGGLVTGALGAGTGALLAGIEGKPLGEGALFGGITGGAIGGLGPLVSGAFTSAGVPASFATPIADIGVGAATGAVAGPLTGQSPLSGVLGGGIAGAASGFLGGGGSTDTAGAGTAATGAVGVGGGTPSGAATGAGAVSSPAGAGASPTGAASPGSVSLPTGAAGTAGATPVDITSGLTGNDPFFLPGTSTPMMTGGLLGTTGSVTDAGLGASSGGLASNLLGWLGNNPGVLLGAGVLGADLLMGNQPLPAETSVANLAAQDQSVARTLTAYGTSGTVPSGLQNVINMNTQAGEAAINSQYGDLGLGNSTMRQQALQQTREAGAAQTATFSEQLLQQGAQWAGLSGQEFNTLLQAQLQQDAALTGAIGNFAGALAGSSLVHPITPTTTA